MKGWAAQPEYAVLVIELWPNYTKITGDQRSKSPNYHARFTQLIVCLTNIRQKEILIKQKLGSASLNTKLFSHNTVWLLKFRMSLWNSWSPVAVLHDGWNLLVYGLPTQWNKQYKLYKSLEQTGACKLCTTTLRLSKSHIKSNGGENYRPNIFPVKYFIYLLGIPDI